MKIDSRPFYLEGNNDTALLFLHGFTGSPSEVYPAAQLVHKISGCTLSGILLPGHGTTPGELNRTSWQDWTAAAHEEAARLSSIYPRVFVAGLSMGGLLAIHTALWLPAAIGAVSINAPVFLRRPWLERLAPLIEKVIPYYPKDAGECTQLEKLGRYAYDCLPVRAFRSMIELRRQVVDGIQHLKAPLLLMQAESDEAVRPDSAAHLRDRATAAAGVTLISLQHSGHVATMGAESDLIAREIAAFMNYSI